MVIYSMGIALSKRNDTPKLVSSTGADDHIVILAEAGIHPIDERICLHDQHI